MTSVSPTAVCCDGCHHSSVHRRSTQPHIMAVLLSGHVHSRPADGRQYCVRNGSVNTLMVTLSPSSTTTPSPVFFTSRFQFVKSPVVEGRQACGSMTSVVELSGRLDQWRMLLVAPVRSLMPAHRLPRRVQRRQYFTLLQQKRSFWTNRVNTDQSRPRRLWRSFDEQLGRRLAAEHHHHRRLDIAQLLRRGCRRSCIHSCR